jgi:FkbM family methyltransferase
VSLAGTVGRIVNRALRPFGVEISRLHHHVSMLDALGNIRRRGYSPSTIIDVGASNGKWSLMAHTVFPEAHFLLIEPLPQNRAALFELLARYKNWHYFERAAGNETGTVLINVTEDLDGSAVVVDANVAGRVERFEMATIDSICQDIDAPSPYLVKLDTHGFEVPILEGMKGIWDQVDFLIVEAYNFRLHSRCLRFFELVLLLEQKGFLPLDLVEVKHRPTDTLLWQMDIVFGRKEQKEFQRRTYGA